MPVSIISGKSGTIVYEDDFGTITFERPDSGPDEILDSSHVLDIEGNIDLAGMEQWLEAAVIATRKWLE